MDNRYQMDMDDVERKCDAYLRKEISKSELATFLYGRITQPAHWNTIATAISIYLKVKRGAEIIHKEQRK
jgi:hypothetical protein